MFTGFRSMALTVAATPRRRRRSAVLGLAAAAGLVVSTASTTLVHAMPLPSPAFALSWSPANPTYLQTITLTATILGCGAGNTVAPTLVWDLNGPAPNTALLRWGYYTPTAIGDTVIEKATIGPLQAGAYHVDAVKLFSPTMPCTSTAMVAFPYPANLNVQGPPAAPTGVFPMDTPLGSTRVNWAAPVNTGALTISGYTVTPSPPCPGCTGLTSAGNPAAPGTTVVGLSHGTSYTFTVTATNSQGTGPPSTPSDPILSAGPPDAPTGLTATPNSDGTVTLAWTAPANDNGAPVSSYELNATGCGCAVVSSSLNPPTMTVALGYDTPSQFQVAGDNIAGTGAYTPMSNSVTIPSAAPDAPTAVTATGNADGTVGLSWVAPADNGAPISSYDVAPTPACSACSGLNVGGGTTSTISGLTLGTSYTFTVTATNSHGPGPSSTPSNAVTPATIPDAPTGVLSTAGANGTVDVAWTAPGDNGSIITGYTLTPVPACDSCTGLTVAGSPATPSTTVAGLTPGTAYTFTVTATNAVGPGPTSSPSAALTPVLSPGVPSAVAATGNADGTVGLSWTPPADKGATISSYTITPTPPCAACTGLIVTGAPAGATTTISGLDFGTAYTFTVGATNSAGTGSDSAPSNSVTPATTPDAPTSVSGTAHVDGSVDLTWVAPSDNGSAITTYVVSPVPACATCTGLTVTGNPAAALTAIAGLTPGTSYTFTVTATNGVGPGAASAPSSPVQPALAPAPPSGVVAAANGDGTLTVSWAAPADNGSAITTYTLTPTPACPACTGLSVSGGLASPATTVHGLTVGASYTFTVTATNGVGTGAPSAPSAAATVTAPPGAGQVPSALEGNAQATLTWNPSTPNGSPITSYRVQAAPGGATCTWTAGPLTCTVTGLNNGTPYSFTVTAVNGAGVGLPSGPSTAVVPAIPALSITLSAAAAVNPLGAEATLAGTGLMPGTTATVVVHSTPMTLAPVSAGSSGTFTSVFRIPTTLTVGTHTLTATATAYDGSQVTAQASFTIPAATVFTQTPTTAAPTTPDTGAARGTGVAVLLIAGGLVLSRASRRRNGRRREPEGLRSCRRCTARSSHYP